MADRTVDVVVDIAGEDVPAGRMWSHRRAAVESATFAYDSAYLARPGAYELDPALPLVAGQQQTPADRGLFAAFSDCAPDRWGRRLIDRAEEHRIERDGGTPRSRGEIDYLLGVRDDLRQGALRFRSPETGAYLADEHTGVPQVVELPKLLHAAERLERDEASETELRELLRGGSSLGGARPKAHVLGDHGRVAIAKFPSPVHDDWDVMRWEAVALDLARKAGIDVPRSELHVIDGRPVLIVDRFDRDGERRIGYVSAMTMLEAVDGDSGWSYVDIAGVIETLSPAASKDLRELWRRIAFTVLISNTDDHLRNHGFLRASSAGWSLSPAFDLNPDPRPGVKYLNTAIDDGAPEARIDTLMRVADLFRIGDAQARDVLGEVVQATTGWREAAAEHGISGTEIDRMVRAFEHEQTAAARAVVASPV
jgi:serine/threonine-protein kinase HipA